ncbi:MAG: HAMP domain-containing protein [Flavobacteriales bacterium]|nr:HAMP domain-containing protein [Flavobacteriales bacterium]
MSFKRKEKALSITRYHNASSASDRTLFIIVLVIAPIVFVVFGFKLSSSIGDNIKVLNAAAKKISLVDIDVNIEVKTRDEIGDLAKEMSVMASSIQSLGLQTREITWLLR